jgi:hypothetical protein
VSDLDQIDREALRRIVREVVEEALREPASPKASVSVATEGTTPGETETIRPIAPRPARLGPAHRSQPRLYNPGAIDALVSANPARLVQGRTGTRYLTGSISDCAPITRSRSTRSRAKCPRDGRSSRG